MIKNRLIAPSWFRQMCYLAGFLFSHVCIDGMGIIRFNEDTRFVHRSEYPEGMYQISVVRKHSLENSLDHNNSVYFGFATNPPPSHLSNRFRGHFHRLEKTSNLPSHLPENYMVTLKPSARAATFAIEYINEYEFYMRLVDANVLHDNSFTDGINAKKKNDNTQEHEEDMKLAVTSDDAGTDDALYLNMVDIRNDGIMTLSTKPKRFCNIRLDGKKEYYLYGADSFNTQQRSTSFRRIGFAFADDLWFTHDDIDQDDARVVWYNRDNSDKILAAPVQLHFVPPTFTTESLNRRVFLDDYGLLPLLPQDSPGQNEAGKAIDCDNGLLHASFRAKVNKIPHLRPKLYRNPYNHAKKDTKRPLKAIASPKGFAMSSAQSVAAPAPHW